jgi:hypothetical protein
MAQISGESFKVQINCVHMSEETVAGAHWSKLHPGGSIEQKGKGGGLSGERWCMVTPASAIVSPI